MTALEAAPAVTVLAGATLGGGTRVLRAGESFPWGRAGLRVLHPAEPDWERPRVRNDDSVVLEVTCGQVAMLLTGDIGAEVEREIVSQLSAARIRILKVGHHGSHNATLREKGLELMTSGRLVAMIPVNRVTAKKTEWRMPFPALLARLVEKTNGRIIDAETGLDDAEPRDLSRAEWDEFVSRVDIQPGWVDYTLRW